MAENPIQTSTKDLGSFEGKYPDNLFNKTFVVDNQAIGHVAKDTSDTIVVFTESGDGRYDIPKSQIVSLGGTITIQDTSSLETYRTDKEAPLPEEKLRPTAEQIQQSAALYEQEKQQQSATTPEAVIQERQQLAEAPRPETTTPSIPEDYHEEPESELVRRIKGAAQEFKELLYAGVKVAKKNAEKKKQELEEKQAQMDAEKIANMEDLAFRFTQDFDVITDEIRARPYAQQVKIYDGLITLLDFQRALAVARRDMAARVQSTVSDSVVPDESLEERPVRKTSRTKRKKTTRNRSVSE